MSGPFLLLIFGLLGQEQGVAPSRMDRPASYRAVPPFPLKAPELRGVQKADEAVSRELLQRYEAASANSTAAWFAADAIRRNLGSQGMLLNSATSAHIARMALYLNTAVAALEEQDWEYARLSLVRAEYMTDKVQQVVGGK